MSAKKNHLEDDEVYTDEDLIKKWKVKKRFLELARALYGLQYHELGPRTFRYKKDEADQWFEQRKKVKKVSA